MKDKELREHVNELDAGFIERLENLEAWQRDFLKRLNELESWHNNSLKFSIHDCPHCGHPTMQQVLPAEGLICVGTGIIVSATIPPTLPERHLCLNCGNMWVNKTSEKWVPYVEKKE